MKTDLKKGVIYLIQSKENLASYSYIMVQEVLINELDSGGEYVIKFEGNSIRKKDINLFDALHKPIRQFSPYRDTASQHQRCHWAEFKMTCLLIVLGARLSTGELNINGITAREILKDIERCKKIANHYRSIMQPDFEPLYINQLTFNK